jgi:hypothetical protein
VYKYILDVKGCVLFVSYFKLRDYKIDMAKLNPKPRTQLNPIGRYNVELRSGRENPGIRGNQAWELRNTA